MLLAFSIPLVHDCVVVVVLVLVVLVVVVVVGLAASVPTAANRAVLTVISRCCSIS